TFSTSTRMFHGIRVQPHPTWRVPAHGARHATLAGARTLRAAMLPLFANFQVETLRSPDHADIEPFDREGLALRIDLDRREIGIGGKQANPSALALKGFQGDLV